MKTLDITEVRDGLVEVVGFGDRDWDTAIYLDGNLLGQDRDGFEEDQLSTKLSKHLAKKMGLPWETRITHIWWRRSSWSKAPATLAEYDAQTLEGYRNAKEDEFAQFITDRVHVPRKVEDERSIAAIGYELSGGDCEQFKPWYESWLSTSQSFNDRFRKEVDARLLVEARWSEMQDNSLQPEFVRHTKELEMLLIGYMLELYRAPKPLDPVALRAKT